MADFEDEESGIVLDLRNKCLKSIEIPNNVEPIGLICDDNDITRIDSVEQHPYLKQVSLANNHIVRMNGISVLKKLNVLNLANNSIVNIEGLEDLVNLTWLDLSGNSIKIISHLQHNTQLHHLDLSDNNIEVITDLSPLICLQTLLLHGNILNSLKPVSTRLPSSLAVLSLESNEIHDLTEITYLNCLENLEQLSIARNPCVTSTNISYDYRAYIVNWCIRLKILDGYCVTQKEKLLAEWLYSQGEGRHYRCGEHYQLIQYLSTVCPLTGSEDLRTEEDAKLSRILNKQRFHHDQLLRQNEPIKAHILNRSHSHTGSESLNQSNEHQSTPERNQFPIAAWTSQNGKRLYVPLPKSSERPPNTVLNDLSVEDCEVKSNISLLDSESVYLTFDGARTPVTPKRPMTAPASDQSNIHSNSPVFTLKERPQTGQTRHNSESRYEAYDRRPIRPLNQNLTKGSKNFEFSPPQKSGSEPAVGVKKQTPPTAMSQDYDTSTDPNISDQENVEKDPIPSGGLSLIKDIAGNRKAQVLTKQTNEVNKNKDNKRQSSVRNNSSVHKPQYNAEKYLNTLNSTSSSTHSTQYKKKYKDNKKDSTLSSTKDSGFMSRPSSEAILSRTSSLEENKAATSIQAFWKGHYTRQYNTEAVSVRKEIRARHAEEHIVLLQSELDKQRKLHEEEKKLRALQMEAIRKLWQEVQSLHQWKSEVLNKEGSDNLTGTSDSNNQAMLYTGTTDTNKHNTLSTTLINHLETEKQQHLEQTCASLQSQVSQLQLTVESLSMQNSGSIGLPEFEEIDETSCLIVTTNVDGDDNKSIDLSLTGEKWTSIPHSLSPYPSEEEEQYFSQVPEFGIPTPPKHLKLVHKDDKSLILAWSKSKLLDINGRPEPNKNILGYRIYVNEQILAMVSHTKTKALISGLNPNQLYKFYVKALSGLGESYESNIIMAKLAIQSTSPVPYVESDSPESEKETLALNEPVMRKHSKRRTRKERSPRSPRSQNTSYTSTDTKPPTPPEKTIQSITEAALSVFTHPKLHTHRRTSSRDFTPDTTDTEKRLSTGSEHSANISTTSNKTDSSLTSNPQDSSLEQKGGSLDSAKSKYFPDISYDSSNTGTGTLTGTAMSETFTIEKRDSYLQSLGKSQSRDHDSGSKIDKSSNNSDSSNLRRTPSSDLSPTEKVQKDPETFKTHRRKRSKDLKDIEYHQGEGQQLPTGVPVIDGRKRHSSGSRPNSPMLDTGDANSTIERKRVPVADALEKGFLTISKSMSQDVPREPVPHRKLPPSPKSKSTRSASPGGSKEDMSNTGNTGHRRSRTTSSGSEDLNNSSSSKNSVISSAAKVLQKLTLFSKSHDKLRNKGKGEEESDNNQVTGRVRRISDSDSDTGKITVSKRAPAPSDSGSGSHSDDNRPSKPHRTHRRTPSDQSGILSFTKTFNDRPAHSPIIMDGSSAKKQTTPTSTAATPTTATSSSNVKRHSSFHSLLPPKHQEKSASGEDLSKPGEETESTASISKKSPNFRSRSPSPITLLTKPAKLASQQGKKSKFFSDLTS